MSHLCGSAASADAEMKLRVAIEDFVCEARRSYRSLSLEEQRRRGPLLTETMLQKIHVKFFDGVGGEIMEWRPNGCPSPPLQAAALLRQIPSLAAMAEKETSITTRVLAAVATRAMVTVYELEEEVCSGERVSQFAELGYGVGLHAFPVVQLLFQLRPTSPVYPVRSSAVISYLLHDGAAKEALLYGGGDVRDLLNRFARHYEEEQLSGTNPPRRGGAVENVRHLGIHIQSYPVLLNWLRQQHCAAARSLDAVLESAAVSITANKELYRRLITAVDSALASSSELSPLQAAVKTREEAAAVPPTNPSHRSAAAGCRRSRGAASSIEVVVRASEAEARGTSLPASVWSTANRHTSSDGGVELHVCIGKRAEPTAASTSTIIFPSAKLQGGVKSRPPAGKPQELGSGSPESYEVTAVAPPPSTSSSSPRPPPPSRRRRGVAVADLQPSSISMPLPPSGSSAHDVVSDAVRSAVSLPSQWMQPLGRPPAAAVPTAATEEDALPAREKHDAGVEVVADAAVEPSVVELLERFVESAAAIGGGNGGTGDVERATPPAPPVTPVEALEALESLRTGQEVPVVLLHNTFNRLAVLSAAAGGDGESSISTIKWSDWMHRRFIPLQHPQRMQQLAAGRLNRLRQRLGAGASCSSPTSIEVVAMASPLEVCWSVGSLKTLRGWNDEVWPFFPALEMLFPASQETFWCDTVGVSRVPTVASWRLSCLVLRRLLCFSSGASSGPEVEARLTAGLLEQLDTCVGLEYQMRLEREMASHRTVGGGDATAVSMATQQRIGAEVLRAMLRSLPQDNLRGEMIFPLDGRWRCGAEGLYSGDPQYSGYLGVLLRSTQAGAPPLHCLVFPRTPHWVTSAVLRCFGVPSLQEQTEIHFSFRPPMQLDMVRVIMEQLQLALPYLQGFYRTHLPHYYAINYASLQRRLATFAVVAAASLTEDVCLRHPSGEVYRMTRAVPLRYVAAHNIFYTTGETVAPAVVADALVSLLFPVAVDAAALLQTREVMTALLGEVSRLEDTAVAATEQQQQLAAAVRPVLRQFNFRPFAAAGAPRGGDGPEETTTLKGEVEQAFTLPSPPFSRYLATFPPGTNVNLDDLYRGARTLSSRRGRGDAAAAVPRLQWREMNGPGGLVASICPTPEWQDVAVQLNQEVEAVIEAALRPLKVGSQGETTSANPNNIRSPSDEELLTDEEEEEDRLPFVWRSIHHQRSLKRQREEGSSGDLSASRTSSSNVYRFAPSPAAGGNTTPPYAIEAERYVYRLLCEEYKSEKDVKVVWVNEVEESGSPYDILVLQPRPSNIRRQTPISSPQEAPAQQAWQVRSYIEVKSTCTSNRQDFEMSLQEVIAAARYGAAYHVYRVFGASTDPLRRMRHTIYRNLLMLWYRSQLTITADIRVSPST